MQKLFHSCRLTILFELKSTIIYRRRVMCSFCEASEALKSAEKVLTLKSIKMTKVCSRARNFLLWEKVFHFLMKRWKIRKSVNIKSSILKALNGLGHHHHQLSYYLIQFPGDWFLNSIEQNSVTHQELNVNIIRMMITPRQIAASNIILTTLETTITCRIWWIHLGEV